MKIREIIFEYNLQNILQLFQKKYLEQKKKDSSNHYESLHDFIVAIEESLRKENKFQFIEPYMKWIVQRYVTGRLNKYEDITSKIIPGLLKYDSLKRKKKLKPEHKDINKIEGINHILDILDRYKEGETLSGKEKEKELERKFYESGEAELLYDDPDYKIIIPKSERASCFFGRNTRWCTAATKGSNYFNLYHDKGSIYIILIKKRNERFQFHFEKNEFMNERDEPINLVDFFEQHSKIKEILKNKVKNNSLKLYFKKFDEYSLDDLLSLIRNNQRLAIEIFERNKNNKDIYNEENLVKLLSREQFSIEDFYEIISDKKMLERAIKNIFINYIPGFSYLELLNFVLSKKDLREILFNDKRVMKSAFDTPVKMFYLLERYPKLFLRLDLDFLFDSKEFLFQSFNNIIRSFYIFLEGEKKEPFLSLLTYLLDKIRKENFYSLFKDSKKNQESFLEMLNYSYGIFGSKIENSLRKFFASDVFGSFDLDIIEKIASGYYPSLKKIF